MASTYSISSIMLLFKYFFPLLKKNSCLLLVVGGVVVGANRVQAMPQAEEKNILVRHAIGNHALKGFVGESSLGWIGGMEWSYQLSFLGSVRILSGMEWKNERLSSFRGGFLQPMYFRTVWTNYDRLILNLGVGGITNYNKIFDQKSTKPYSGFNVGVVLGGEVEIFVLGAIELVFSGGPILYFLKDPFERFSYYVNAGIKFNF
jgi:hypothetical protein